LLTKGDEEDLLGLRIKPPVRQVKCAKNLFSFLTLAIPVYLRSISLPSLRLYVSISPLNINLDQV
jgi:hypothetical protein